MNKDLGKEVEDLLEKSRAYKGSTSRLRKEITKVSLLTQPAVEILYRHLNSERVAVELVKDAKWVLSTAGRLFPRQPALSLWVKTRKAASSTTSKKTGAKPKPKKPVSAGKKKPDSRPEESQSEVRPQSNFSLDYEPLESDKEKQADKAEATNGEDTEF